MEVVAEAVPFEGGTVDESGPYPVIRGALICGLRSQHGYDYLAESWTPDALRQYAERPCYEGHRNGPRLPSEKVGIWRDPRVAPDGRPVGDIHLEPDHPMTPRLVRAAKHDPKRYAFSHRAEVSFGKRAGRKVVESLGRVYSVDVVDYGGTTAGIFEHGKYRESTVGKISLRQYGQRFGPRWGAKKWATFEQVCEDMGGMADMPAVDEPPPDAADGGDLKAALMSALSPMLDEAFESGDAAAVVSALKDFIKLHAKHTGKAAPDDTPDDADDGPPVAKEAAPTADQLELARLRREKAVRAIADREYPGATELVLEAAAGFDTEAKQVAFLRQVKGQAAATQPRSQGRQAVAESAPGKPAPTGTDEAAALLRAESARLRGVVPQANGTPHN
jgi:hypothetical protein